MTSDSISRFKFRTDEVVTFIRPFSLYDEDHTIAAYYNNGWPRDDKYFYMGVLGLILALVGIWRAREWKPWGYVFLVGGLVGMALALGDQLTYGFILNLPPFSFFRLPFQFLMVTNLALGVFGAYGLSKVIEWLRDKKVSGYKLFGIVAVVFLLTYRDLYVNAKALRPEVDARKWFEEPEVVGFLKENLEDEARATNQWYYYPSVKMFLESQLLFFLKV